MIEEIFQVENWFLEMFLRTYREWVSIEEYMDKLASDTYKTAEMNMFLFSEYLYMYRVRVNEYIFVIRIGIRIHIRI